MWTSLEIFLDDVWVEYTVTPEEPAVMYPNDDAHPGWPAEVEIHKVSYQNKDITWLLSESQIEELCTEILNLDPDDDFDPEWED